MEVRDQSSRCERMVAAELEISGCTQMCFGPEQTGPAIHVLKVIYILRSPCCLASYSFALCFHSLWLTPFFGLQFYSVLE